MAARGRRRKIVSPERLACLWTHHSPHNFVGPAARTAQGTVLRWQPCASSRLLLHAAAAKLQFGADANNTRKGSKRRRNIERVYAVARKALPLEEQLEAEERWGARQVVR